MEKIAVHYFSTNYTSVRFVKFWENCDLNMFLLGEFSRCYEPDELTTVLALYQSIYMIGFVVGPGVNILFTKIDFFIGNWHLNEANFIGMFMAVLLMFYIVASYFGISDLSKEYDLKELAATVKTTECKTNQKNEVIQLKEIVQNFDLMLIMLSSLLLNYAAVTVELLLPLIASLNFHWSLWKLSSVITCSVLCYAVLSFACVGKCIRGNQDMFNGIVACMVATCLCWSLMIISTSVKIQWIVGQMILMVFIILLNIFSGITSITLSRNMILLLVPSHSTNYCEGIRCAFSRTGGVIGFFNVAMIYPYLEYVSPVIIFITIVHTLLFVLRRKYFKSLSLYASSVNSCKVW